MKKILILVFLCALTCHAARKEYKAEYSAVHPVLDGRIEGDSAWKNVPWSDGFEKRVTGGKPDADTRFKALYTDDALYIAAECLEPNMDKLADEHNYIEFWLCDVVEVFLIPLKDEMIHLIYSARNNANEEIPGKTSVRTGHQTGWIAKSRMEKDRWMAEFCIPLYLLGVAPQRGDLAIPFNLCRNSTPKKELSSWSFQKGSFKSEQGFGRMILKKVPAAAAAKVKKSLSRPHWISLIQRWRSIRGDYFWQDVIAANPGVASVLDAIERNPAEYSVKADVFAENLAKLETQRGAAERKHREAVMKLLFED